MSETEQTYEPALEGGAEWLQAGPGGAGLEEADAALFQHLDGLVAELQRTADEHRHQWEFIEAWWTDLPLGDRVEHWATLFCPCGAVVDREIEREPLDKPEPGDD